LQNIKLEFLPPHTTSVIQPCDAGIIKNFKANYRKLLVKKWIDDIENELEQVLEELEMSYDCIKLSAEEYINVDEELQTMDTPTEESVVRDILKEQDELIPYNEGKIALEVAKKYLEQSQFATEDDIYLLRQIIKKAESYYRSSLKQTTIDKYFITQ
ncbi:13424_t:CDS:2, partial [Racocetra fulgida]